MIKVLGIYVHNNEKVFLKLVNVINANMSAKHQSMAIQMAGEVFFPALAATSCNYVLENAIW